MSDDCHYSMLIEWSDRDDVYIVSLPEWRAGAKTHGATYDEAVRNGEDVLAMLIAYAEGHGKPLPAPRVFAMSA